MKKVLIINRLDETIVNKLEKEFELSFLSTRDTSKEALYHAVKNVHGIIGHGLRVDEALLQAAQELEIVCNISVGFNNFDVQAMIAHQVMGTNTPDVLSDTVADLVFGLVLATARRIPELDKFVKQGKWTKASYEDLYGLDVHHKTMGIIGMGRIGQAIANRAHHGFHMNILYHSRSKKEDAEKTYGAQYRELDDLLMESDFVVLMTPLTNETEGLLSLREFKLMKKTAIFINGSRGKTIVEADLIKALENNDIAAAGLDVFEQEPIDPNNKLLTLPNLVATPHIGSATAETEEKMAKLAYENLVAGLRGKKPISLVSDDMWKQ